MDLSALGPNEIMELKAALESYEPPEDPLKTLATVVDLLCEKVKAYEERIAKLEGIVIDDLMGGISALAQETENAQRLSGIKSKYGSLFPGEYGSYLKDRLGDPDKIYELLDQHLQEMSKTEGYTDEIGDASINDIAKEIGRRVAEITGKSATVETAAVEVPAEPAKEEPKAEEDPFKSIKDQISKLKERSGQAA